MQQKKVSFTTEQKKKKRKTKLTRTGSKNMENLYRENWISLKDITENLNNWRDIQWTWRKIHTTVEVSLPSKLTSKINVIPLKISTMEGSGCFGATWQTNSNFHLEVEGAQMVEFSLKNQLWGPILSHRLMAVIKAMWFAQEVIDQ